MLYRFESPTGSQREVVLLTSREPGDELDLEFLEGNFDGPLRNVTWVDKPWIEKTWFPEVPLVDGRRA